MEPVVSTQAYKLISTAIRRGGRKFWISPNYEQSVKDGHKRVEALNRVMQEHVKDSSKK